MTLKNFFVGRAIVFLAILIIGVGVFAYRANFLQTDNEGMGSQEEILGPATFMWMFEEADTLNPDGNPETNVSLIASYQSGVQTKLIDTTPGSCGELPDADADSVPGTVTIQCYSAGLGYRFKVTKGETSYLVQRKMFEEASPEYEPPVQEYEVVAEFPL